MKFIKELNCIEKGITLTSLVITIIILIILASITISLAFNNGIFDRAKFAKDLYYNAVNSESSQITSVLNEIDKYSNSEENHSYVDSKGVQRRTTNEVPEGITEVKAIVISCSSGGVGNNIIPKGDIITSFSKEKLDYNFVSRQYEIEVSEFTIKTNGQAGIINFNFSAVGINSNYFYLFY